MLSLYQARFPRTIAVFISCMSLKLITLNVERSKHLDRVLPFLAEQKADVVCLQEIAERDTRRFREAAGENMVFAPMTQWVKEGPPTVIGVGIFSPYPFVYSVAQYYHGNGDALAVFDETSIETKAKTVANPLLIAEVEKEEVSYRIATTHFTWTPDGSASDYQRQDLQSLFGITSQLGDFVLCGDFNIPRGGELYTELIKHFTDEIPPQYVTSLDATLHRAGKTHAKDLSNKMVDYIFTTPGYTAADVEMISGVSDHCAITATISTR